MNQSTIPQPSSTDEDEGLLELCNLLHNIGPRRFYALLDLLGVELTDEIRTKVLRLEQCGCKLDKTEEK